MWVPCCCAADRLSPCASPSLPLNSARSQRSAVSPLHQQDSSTHYAEAELMLTSCFPQTNELASTMNSIASGTTCQSTASLSFKKSSASTDASYWFQKRFETRSMRMPPTAIAMAVIVHIIG